MAHLALRLGITAGAAALVAVVLPSAASATPQDVDFLNRLEQVGITTSNPYVAIGYALKVCRQLDLGVPPSTIVDFVFGDIPSFNRKDAENYVVLANMTYCPPA